jgi:diguanylate cyclase (GGDEF)-like protein
MPAPAENPSAALGEAFGGRARECAREAQGILLGGRWVGRAASQDFHDSREITLLVSNLLVARWLITGQGMDADEARWLEQRGRLAAVEQLSIVNVTRSYLVWRDVALRALEEEAARLGTGPDVLQEARLSVQAAADAAIMRMARAYDAETERLREQLASERESFRHQALHDPLTGVPNRVLLFDRLQQAINSARRQGRHVAVLLIDLDEFKRANDEHGHEAGDALLRHVARCLGAELRGSDTLARLAGDEFAIVLPDCRSQEAGQKARAKVESALQRPLRLGSVELCARGSVGIAFYPEDGEEVDALLGAADMSMYRSKRAR